LPDQPFVRASAIEGLAARFGDLSPLRDALEHDSSPTAFREFERHADDDYLAIVADRKLATRAIAAKCRTPMDYSFERPLLGGENGETQDCSVGS
jgi:hypothetical protein